jgi:hypothetical protein
LRPFKASDYFTDFKMPTTPFGGITGSDGSAPARFLDHASAPAPAHVPAAASQPLLTALPPHLISTGLMSGGNSLDHLSAADRSSAGNVIAQMSSELDKMRIANFSLEQAVHQERASSDAKAQQMVESQLFSAIATTWCANPLVL